MNNKEPLYKTTLVLSQFEDDPDGIDVLLEYDPPLPENTLVEDAPASYVLMRELFQEYLLPKITAGTFSALDGSPFDDDEVMSGKPPAGTIN